MANGTYLNLYAAHGCLIEQARYWEGVRKKWLATKTVRKRMPRRILLRNFNARCLLFGWVSCASLLTCKPAHTHAIWEYSRVYMRDRIWLDSIMNLLVPCIIIYRIVDGMLIALIELQYILIFCFHFNGVKHVKRGSSTDSTLSLLCDSILIALGLLLLVDMSSSSQFFLPIFPFSVSLCICARQTSLRCVSVSTTPPCTPLWFHWKQQFRFSCSNNTSIQSKSIV